MALLVIIYLCFIGLGMYTSTFGAAWPVMYKAFGTSISNAGLVTIIIPICFVVFGTFFRTLDNKIGTGKIVMIGTTVLGVSQFMVTKVNTLIGLVVAAAFWGMGSGIIDYSCNAYMVRHYKQKYLSWLHGIWGLGALLGPIVVSFFIGKGNWEGSYYFNTIVQLVLTVLLIISIPLWKKNEDSSLDKQIEPVIAEKAPAGSYLGFTMSTILTVVVYSFFTVGIETTTNYWGSSYFNTVRGVPAGQAATYISVFFTCLMAARIILGFISDKVTTAQIIYTGQIIATIGMILLLIPTGKPFLAVVAVGMMGFGNGPAFPTIIHAVPNSLDPKYGGAILNIQLSSAAISGAILPALLGGISSFYGLAVFPILLVTYSVITIVSFTILHRKMGSAKKGQV